jgi:hypothetical protein
VQTAQAKAAQVQASQAKAAQVQTAAATTADDACTQRVNNLQTQIDALNSQLATLHSQTSTGSRNSAYAEIAQTMAANGQSAEQIANLTNLTSDQVQKFLQA